MWYCCATALAGTGPSPKAMWRPVKASARPPCVREETGLTGIKLMDGFRESVEYSPKPGVKKQVVYFLGTTEQEKLVRQEEEISEIMWAPLSRAAELVSFANDKRLLRHAQRRLGLLPTEPEEKPNMEEATE